MIRVARRRTDEHKVCGRPLLEEFADVGRHALVIGVVVRRLKIGALVLQHLEQFILQHLIHLTDLVDEENAAMCVRHEPRLRLGDTAVREALLRALIDGIVYGAEQRIRHVTRVPAQRRTVRFHKGRVFPEGRHGSLLRRLKDQPRRRRLTNARRSVEEEMLRIGRGELRHERAHRTLLSHDLVKVLGAQQLHNRLREVNLLKRLKILALLLVVRRLRTGTFLRDDLTANVIHVLLVILLKFLVHLALDAILQIAPRENARQLLRHTVQDLGDLRLGRRRGEQRILLKDAHERQHALTPVLRAHECHCVHLARPDDQALRPHRIGEHAKDRGNLRIHSRLGRKFGRLFLLTVAAE